MATLTQKSIAVIGGGIAGLAAAHYLLKSGAKVTLFEASSQLGGLGTFFSYNAVTLERFYHCIIPSDEHLLRLLKDLEIDDRVYWESSRFGYLSENKIFPLNSASDLLRFQPLAFADRIRVGLTALYGGRCSAKGLDNKTTAEWLTRLSGEKAFEIFWLPMLRAKFGDRYDQIPALWFWTRFNREKGKQKEVKGYVRGGYRTIIDSLAASIERRGGIVQLNSPIKSLDIGRDGRVAISSGSNNHVFDACVVTLPPELLKNISRGSLQQKIESLPPPCDYQGVVNTVFLLRRSLSDYYWVAAMGSDQPFQGIVETSTLIHPEDRGDMHIVHVMNYVHRTDALYQIDDDEHLTKCSLALLKIFPKLKKEDFITGSVFRAPHVEPLSSPGYMMKKPPTELVPGRVILASTAQVYPDVTSWNGSVGLVNEAIKPLLQVV